MKFNYFKSKRYEEQVKLKISNKFCKYHELTIISEEKQILDLFKGKCESYLEKDISNSRFSLGYRVCIYDMDKETVINECVRIANELDIKIKIDNGFKDNMFYYFRPVLIPIFFIIFLVYGFILIPLSKFLWKRGYECKWADK